MRSCLKPSWIVSVFLLCNIIAEAAGSKFNTCSAPEGGDIIELHCLRATRSSCKIAEEALLKAGVKYKLRLMNELEVESTTEPDHVEAQMRDSTDTDTYKAGLAKAFIKRSKPPFVFDSKKHIDTRLYEAAKLAVGLLSESDEDNDSVGTVYKSEARKAFQALLPEVGPDIFHFPFLTRAFCEDLLEYVNLRDVEGLWVYNTDGLENEKSGARDLLFQVWHVPGFHNFWRSALQWIIPIMHARWPDLMLTSYGDPTIIKYDMENYPLMNEHVDFETLSFIIVLADNYSGGGTYFPRWNLTITGQEPGSMVMYPGGLSHVHAGKRITSGERYVLLGDITGED
jgi:hypothetical protein